MLDRHVWAVISSPGLITSIAAGSLLILPQSVGAQEIASGQATISVAEGGSAVATGSTAELAAATRESRSRVVEEIIVTAQKREENLQDVPISVSAFSADQLDAKGVDNPADLQKSAPSLTYSTAIGYSLVYLRGVGSDAFFMADPSVALYIDGIYFPFAQGLAQSFGALERVEVLKGPQGTLFGRNAVGGAINIITKAPSNHFETSLQTSYGSFDQFRARVHTNLPLTDEFAMSVSGFYSSEDSYYHNSTANGRPLDSDVGRGVRVKGKWTPSEAFDLTLAAFKLNQQGPGSLITPNNAPTPLLGGTIEPDYDYQAELSSPTFATIDNTVFYGQANAYFDAFDVRLLGSTQSIDNTLSYDYDGSARGLIHIDVKKLYADVKSAELQVLSSNTSWGSEWLTWIAGGYLFTSRQGFAPIVLRALDLDLRNGAIAGLPIPPELLDSLISQLPPGVVPNGGFPLTALVDTDSLAGFAQATARISDWLSMTVGTRYQVEKRKIVESKSEIETSDGNVLPIPLCDAVHGGDLVGCKRPGARSNINTYSFKPKVSLDFRPVNDVLVYLSYQQALKSATFNVVTLYDPPDLAKPEELDAYELGVKSTLFDRRVTLNAAAFYYDIRNQQVQFISVAQGGAASFENAKGARVRGLDFDALVIVMPELVDDLALTVSGAYLDGKYTSYSPARGYAEDGLGLAFTDGDFSGNQTVRTPEFSGVVALSKTWSLAQGALELAADTYYNSGFYYSPQNEDRSYQAAYQVFNARVSYFHTPWNARLTIYGNNLTGEKYTAGKFLQDFGAGSYLAAPATYGVRVNWDFQ